MQVEQISDTLYKFTFALFDQPEAFTVNVVACVGQDGILLVDAGWAQTAETLNERLRELGDGNVKLIIITHPHLDHYGGAQFFGKEATLIAHMSAKDQLAGRYFALDELPGQALPTIALEDALSLRFNGEEISIIPTPGHTRSDMVVHFVDAGVVCVGDLVFSDTFPGLDLARGGDIAQYVATIGNLIDQFPDVKLIAGHGRDYSLDDLREHHRMALGTTEVIRQGMADGKTAHDMVAEEALKDWAEWSSPLIGSEAWINQACESLSGERKRSIAEPLTYTIIEEGIGAAVAQYKALKETQADAFNLGENELNMLGYQLLWREMIDAAIQVFQLNVEAFPQSANPYDSLGEAYMISGEDALAIENYERALAVNPNMASAIDALERLRSTDC
jgi:glyoxylase-like metal-dependent hydrolase (beta-lactamase superfamily II)